MEFDYSKLLGRITEVAGSQASFARKIDLSERTISLKLNSRIAFKQDEILRACDALGISHDDIGTYFFKEKVQGD